MIRPRSIALILSFVAVPAAAFSPAEAASAAQRLGRPLPSVIQVAPRAQPADRPGMLFAPGGAALPIYLNRHGGNYQCGDDDSSRNLSSVVCPGSGEIGGFSGSDSQWTRVLDCVTEQFAPFNVRVTDVEPTSGAYVESLVGGTPDQAGMPQGVGGVAPFSCGLIDTAVVYTFADVYGGDTQGICETVAQEVAHAFGLDHEFLCEDPMTYLSGCGDKSFLDTYSPCGEFEPRQCQCGDASQNSVQMMLQVLGASDGSVAPPPTDDLEIPTVSITSPADGDILEANGPMTVVAEAHDDVGLPTVELEWDFTASLMFCPASFEQTGNYECSRQGDRYTWNINVGAGARTFRVHVVDVVGNEATTDTRAVWLSEDGSGPPTDGGAPTVFVATPADGSVLPANDTMEVVAAIADDSGIARAELVWSQGDQVFACPLDTQGVTCVVDGSTYTWRLEVGEGSRSFYVRATDVVGNVTESAGRTIELDVGATAIDDDDDDTLGAATTLGCGESLDLVASDADWFSVDAPSGRTVTVSVSGDAAGSVSLVATRGPLDTDVLGNGADDVDFTGDGEPVGVAVVPDDAAAGNYHITVVCEESTGEGASAVAPAGGCGCTQTSSDGVGAGLGLLVLTRLRRRHRRAG